MRKLRIFACVAVLGFAFFADRAQSLPDYPCNCEVYCAKPFPPGGYDYYSIPGSSRFQCISHFGELCPYGGSYSCPQQ